MKKGERNSPASLLVVEAGRPVDNIPGPIPTSLNHALKIDRPHLAQLAADHASHRAVSIPFPESCTESIKDLS